MLRFFPRWFRLLLLIGIGVGLCLLPGAFTSHSSMEVIAQVVTGDSLVDQGLRNYQAGKFREAIAQWEGALPKITVPQQLAIVHTNLGQAYRQVGQLDQAIAQWDKAIQIYERGRDRDQRRSLSQVLTEQAQAYSDLGQHQTAIERLQRAVQLARENHDPLTEAAAQGALGNAYWALGSYDKALDAHQTSLAQARQINNSNYVATAFNNLGNVYASRAERYCFRAKAANLEREGGAEANYVNLANQDKRNALENYQKSSRVGDGVNRLTEARALLNLNRLLEKSPAGESATTLATVCPPEIPVSLSDNVQSVIAQNQEHILALLTAEPDSQDKIYGLINLANSLMLKDSLGRMQSRNAIAASTSRLDPIALLKRAIDVSQKIQDRRAESFALGTLGEIYETDNQYPQAMSLTREAQLKAQQVGAADSLYRWQWQIGRILKATGRREEAVAAYRQAIATLQSIRGDIVVANKDLQFDFRDSIEPVYRELIGLYLQSNSAKVSQFITPSSSQPTASKALDSRAISSEGKKPEPDAETANIKAALDILELLKLAELQNFFGDECVQVARDAVTAEQSLPSSGSNEPQYGLTDPRAAVVYSIVLDDSAYMILRLPDGTLKKYPVLFSATLLGTSKAQGERVPIGGEQLRRKIDDLREFLEDRSTERYASDEAKAVYDALIRPLENDLKAANPSTLVFINDGVLRKVPMAALYDGEKFLIEKYPVATTPSLSLTTRRPFQRNNTKALVLGLTVEQSPFSALPNVANEVKEVQKILGGTKLVNQEFTRQGMQQRLERNSYPIIHMATHGKFGADADSTFLLAYNERITINQLDEVLRTRRSDRPVELLTLSACQTAAGDNRSALGIAGIAVRAGVKSAVATLWFISDQPTVDLIEKFYQQLLQSGVSKAQALQRAQLELLSKREYRHPAVWSPFILIGNWL